MANAHYYEHRHAVFMLTRRFQCGTWEFDPIEQVAVPDLGKVSWFSREASAAPLHPVIDRALRLAPAANLYQLVREYPHASDTDSSRIAYTRNDADGERDRQTVTSAAKYLTRHFPTLHPHEIRDLTATLGPQKFLLWDTLEGIVRAAQEGPRSCMQWDDDSVNERGAHPYEVYEPRFGWRMAVRMEGEQIMGRCLVNIDPHDDSNKVFVRSYRRDPEGGYSHSDEGLEAWLRDAGYSKACGWEGCCIAHKTPATTRYSRRDEPLLPYLDGDSQHVRECGSGEHLCFRIVEDGEDYDYDATNTNGFGDEATRYACSCCGELFSDVDESLNAGYYSDELVGPCCADEFVDARGRNGREYYVHIDNTVEVNGRYYHEDYLDDNNIVELYDGSYGHTDDCVCIDDTWYPDDYEYLVLLEDTQEHAIENEGCWRCTESEAWFSDAITPVEIDGHKYHPDSDAAQQHAEEQTETNEE